MGNPFREFTVKEYIKSFNKDHPDQPLPPGWTPDQKITNKYYSYNEFNAFQHAYASASAEYVLGAEFSNTFGYGKELGQVVLERNRWDLNDTNKDLQNNDLGRDMGEFAKRHGISPKDLRDRIYYRTKNNPVYYNPNGLWNYAPDNYRNYKIVPGKGGDWAIGGYRWDVWPYVGIDNLKQMMKNTPTQPTNLGTGMFSPTPYTTQTVHGEIIKGPGGGGTFQQAHPNDETPSMARDRLKHDSAAKRGHYDSSSPHDQPNEDYLKNDPSMKKPKNMTEDQYFEILRKLYENRDTLKSFFIRREEKVTGEIIPKGQSGKSFYDPVTEQVNYDQTQRVVNQNGNSVATASTVTSTSDASAATASAATQAPAASQPFNRKKPFSTPNSQSIKNTLYSGVMFGARYMGGYLADRYKTTLLGKKFSKINDEINKYVNLAKTFAKNQWNAASNAIKAFAKAAWQSFARTAIGQVINSAIGWIGAQLATAWAAVTSIPVIGGLIGFIGAVVAKVVTAIFAFLFPW